jgi:hypothetical protein
MCPVFFSNRIPVFNIILRTGWFCALPVRAIISIENHLREIADEQHMFFYWHHFSGENNIFVIKVLHFQKKTLSLQPQNNIKQKKDT